MAVLASVGLASCAPSSQSGDPTYVGAATCIQCHETEGTAWTGSHHDQAMAAASPATVLGAFDGQTLVSGPDTAEFLRRGDDFLVRTEGQDGREDFPVAYTFGVAPLQQYLLRLPGNRLQAYTGAWDARPTSEGGQRWFSLYPEHEAGLGGDLHWAGPNQTWNTGCAPCHSTGLVNTYDAEQDAFNTSFSDEDVSCEACHGPGSAHVSAAREGRSVAVPAPLSGDGGAWARAPNEATAHRVAALPNRAEVDTCAPCHSRRAQTALSPRPGDPLLDGYEPALLREGLYHADGQIDDEVYVYGSFLQSRMFTAGVTCGDCHEPHGMTLRDSGNALCTRCHSEGVFDTQAHYLHDPSSPGGQCVACHMPTKTYMGVDPRRDHGLRIPRPDVSAALGTPNACASCHDEPPEWAADILAARYGPKDPTTHVAQAIHDGRRGDPTAFDRLATLATDPSRPAILRGTALSLMGNYARGTVPDAIADGLQDSEPLVRLGALDALQTSPPDVLAPLVFPLLEDSLRALRVRAARLVAPVPAGGLSSNLHEAARTAWTEVEAAHAANAGRSDAWVQWADLQIARGRALDAETALRQAIAMDSLNTAAWLNLSDLLRATNREHLVGRTLAEANARLPDRPQLQHATGLHHIRLGALETALPLLEAASRGAPENARLGYVHAVAVASAGDTARAVALLEGVARNHPFDSDVLSALAGYHHALDQAVQAMHYAERLSQVLPDDPAVLGMLSTLRAESRNRRD